MNGTATGQGAAALDNNGVYTITAISSDGRTITVDQTFASAGSATAAANAVEVRLVPPNGTSIAISGSGNNNDGLYTVRWPTNAELAAAPFNAGAGFSMNAVAPDVVDGDVLFFSGQVTNTGAETVEDIKRAIEAENIGLRVELDRDTGALVVIQELASAAGQGSSKVSVVSATASCPIPQASAPDCRHTAPAATISSRSG